DLNDSAGGSNDLANVNGVLTLNGTTIFKANKLGTVFDTGAPYVLMNYASRTGAGTIQTASTNTRRTLTLTFQPTQLLLNVGGTDPLNLTWSGGTSGSSTTWNFTDQNWNSNVEKFFNEDSVTFNDAGNATVTLAGELRPNAMTVSATTKDYAFAGSGSINAAS